MDSSDAIKNSTLEIPASVSTNFTLFWDILDKRYLRHNTQWSLFLVLIYLLILLIGTAENLMVILVVVCRPQMRTVTNIFIMNLAVADLIVSIVSVPTTLIANIFIPWILGQTMCKSLAYVQGVSICGSAYSVAAIAIDRCRAIHRPYLHSSCISKPQILLSIFTIWSISLSVTIPWVFVFNQVILPDDGLPYCIETWENDLQEKVNFIVSNLIFCYIIPLILITLSNTIVWWHVSRRRLPEDVASSTSINQMHRRARRSVRKMLGIITCTFLFSWLPLYTLVTILQFYGDINDNWRNIIDTGMPCAQWLGSLNSCINPVLYAFFDSKFREMSKSLLPTWLPCSTRNKPKRTGYSTAGATITKGITNFGMNRDKIVSHASSMPMLKFENMTTRISQTRLDGSNARLSVSAQCIGNRIVITPIDEKMLFKHYNV